MLDERVEDQPIGNNVISFVQRSILHPSHSYRSRRSRVWSSRIGRDCRQIYRGPRNGRPSHRCVPERSPAPQQKPSNNRKSYHGEDNAESDFPSFRHGRGTTFVHECGVARKTVRSAFRVCASGEGGVRWILGVACRAVGEVHGGERQHRGIFVQRGLYMAISWRKQNGLNE
jgi:hypothetical protein